MKLGVRQDLVDIEAQKKVDSHCASFFLRPDDDNPRVNAGCASQAVDERKLVLYPFIICSSLPVVRCWGAAWMLLPECEGVDPSLPWVGLCV